MNRVILYMGTMISGFGSLCCAGILVGMLYVIPVGKLPDVITFKEFSFDIIPKDVPVHVEEIFMFEVLPVLEMNISNEKSNKNKHYSNSLSVETIKRTEESGIIKAGVGVSRKVYELACEYYANLPISVRMKIESHGWEIIIKPNLKAAMGYSYSIQGLTNYGEKCVYLDNRSIAVTDALYHEIGHAIDSINDFPSSSNEFLALYEEEKADFTYIDAVGDGHEISNHLEFFASIFSSIIKGASTSAPGSEDFVRIYVNN